MNEENDILVTMTIEANSKALEKIAYCCDQQSLALIITYVMSNQDKPHISPDCAGLLCIFHDVATSRIREGLGLV